MRNKSLSIITFLLFVMLSAPGWAAVDTHIAKSASYAHVKEAVDAASVGDTVLVPPGNVTWNSGLSMTKGVTLIGAGIGNTVITWNGGAGTVFGYNPDNPMADEMFRVSSFTVNLNGVADAIGVQISNSGTLHFISNVRIDHNRIINSLEDGGYAIKTNGSVYGLIDNNEVENCPRTFRFLGDNDNSWSDPLQIGSRNYLYVEDNKISNPSAILISSGWGARWVFRFNTVDLSVRGFGILDAHGNLSSVRGVVGNEVYENTFYNAADRGDGQKFLDQWGGNSICFNNTNSGDETRCGISLSERDCTKNGGYKDCDPPGIDPVTAYVWNNVYNGSPMVFGVEGNDTVVMLEEKRDYWSDQKQSNAGPTDYFSQGVSANRPTTSSDDDCYWETDTKKLYRSIGANNWTFIYTPYTYPHPLALTTRDISFAVGWNWISFNVLSANLSLDSVFTGILSRVEQVKTQTQSAIRTNNTWKGDLADMAGIGQYKMYKLKVNAACTLNVIGTAISPTTPIQLQTGWNWVAYLPTTAMPIGTALAGISGQVLEVKSLTQSATYCGGAWSGTLTQLDPGRGYAIKMSAPGTLTYPAIATAASYQQKEKQ